MSSLSDAIAQFEGFQIPGSLAQRNNNPGNLVYAPWEAVYGGTPNGFGGFAGFPSSDAGMQALNARLNELEKQGASLADVIHTWAGSQYPGNSQSSEDNYTNFVAQQTGLNPSEPILSQTVKQQGSLTSFGFKPNSSTPKSMFHSHMDELLGNFSFERIATGILGLICIGGAIFLFKPTQHVIVNAGKQVAETASSLAVAG